MHNGAFQGATGPSVLWVPWCRLPSPSSVPQQVCLDADWFVEHQSLLLEEQSYYSCLGKAPHLLSHRSRAWKFKVQVCAGLVPSEGYEGRCLRPFSLCSLPPVVLSGCGSVTPVFTWHCVCVCVWISLFIRTQAYWIRAYPNVPIFTWLLLSKACLQIRSYSEVLGGKISTYKLESALIQPTTNVEILGGGWLPT